MANTDAVILTTAIVTVGSTFAASIMPEDVGGKGGLPAPRLVFGQALTFTGLSFLGAFAPQIATGLGVAIALTAATWYGLPIADNFFNGAHTPVGKAPTTPTDSIPIIGDITP